MSAAGERRGAAGFSAVARAVAWRSIHNFLTNPAFLAPAIVFPLFFFIAFAGGLSAVGKVPGFDFPSGYTAFQFVFVLLQSAAFGGVFTGFGIARDFEIGFANRYLLAAANRNGIIAGYAIAALTRAAITWTVLSAIALIAGMEVGGVGVELFGLYGLAILTNLTATLWAAGVAMRVRSIQGGPLMQFPVFLILFLAPVYVPLSPSRSPSPCQLSSPSGPAAACGGPRRPAEPNPGATFCGAERAGKRCTAGELVGGVAGAGPGERLVALGGTTVPEDSVYLGGRERRGGGEQLDRVDGAGAQLDLLGRAVLEQLAGFDPAL